MFEQVYRDNGGELPVGAKASLNWRNRQAWLNGLSPDKLALVRSLTGAELAARIAANKKVFLSRSRLVDYCSLETGVFEQIFEIIDRPLHAVAKLAGWRPGQ